MSALKIFPLQGDDFEQEEGDNVLIWTPLGKIKIDSNNISKNWSLPSAEDAQDREKKSNILMEIVAESDADGKNVVEKEKKATGFVEEKVNLTAANCKRSWITGKQEFYKVIFVPYEFFSDDNLDGKYFETLRKLSAQMLTEENGLQMVDLLGYKSGRKSLLYNFARDMFRILPDEQPKLDLPSCEVLVALLLHVLACVKFGYSLSAKSWSNEQRVQRSETLISVMDILHKFYQYYCTPRTVFDWIFYFLFFIFYFLFFIFYFLFFIFYFLFFIFFCVGFPLIRLYWK